MKTIVRVNDRGPHAKSRLIDLSYSAVKDLGLISSGTANVTLKVILLGKLSINQIVDDEIEIELADSEISGTTIFPISKPEFLEKKYQYMNLVKQADGSSKIVYSDTHQR